MSNALKVALSTVVLGVTLLVALPQGAQAWKTQQSGGAECSAQNSVVLTWSFTNTEPTNKPEMAMDVVARDTVSGKTSAKVTAKPGETVTGTIDTGMDSVGKGQIVLELTWTDGRNGVDTRKVSYDATTCKVVEVCRDNEIVTVNINDVKDSDADVEACEPNEIQVCRDNQIVTILEDEMKDTDSTDVENCDPEEETTKVCRDGEIVTINVRDVKDSDGDTEDCDEEEMPEVLPNTGPGAAFAGLFGISAIGASLRSWTASRAGLRQRMLGLK